jgi:DOPA 4,5-dioxygenase
MNQSAVNRDDTGDAAHAGIDWYHAHVYFELDDLDATEQVRQRLMAAMPGAGVVHKLFPRQVGPHPLPMFEIDFPSRIFDSVLALLEQERGARSVLIHPVTDDDLAAHTTGAQWLGSPLPLLLERLS